MITIRTTSCLLVVLLSLTAAGQTIHVDVTATPPGNGTQASPFPSLQDGLDAAAAGATIQVAPGTYPGGLQIPNLGLIIESTGGRTVTAIDGQLTVRLFDLLGSVGDPPTVTTIRGFDLINGQDGDHAVFDAIGAHGITMEACRIADSQTTWNVLPSSTCHLVGGAGIFRDCIFESNNGGFATILGQANDVTVERCEFVGNTTGCCQVRTENAALAIEDSRFEASVGGAACERLVLPTTGTNCTVRRSLFLDTTGTAIEATNLEGVVLEDCDIFGSTGGGVLSNLNDVFTMRRSRIVNCGTFGVVTNGSGQSFTPNLTTLVTNSIIAGCASEGLLVFEVNATIDHCTITGNAATATSGLQVFSANAVVSNTIIWDNVQAQLGLQGAMPVATLDNCNIQGGWAGAGSGNIDADPQFVSAASDDYRLLSSSPCIDAGFAGSQATDFQGDLRPIGAGPDIGADEAAVPLYPGTNEDFVLETFVTAEPGDPGFPVKEVQPGDLYGLRFFSPGGAFDLQLPVLIGQAFVTGTPPTSSFPGIAIDPSATPDPIILFDGSTVGGLTGFVMPPGGLTFLASIPPQLTPGLSILFQAFMVTGPFTNGIFASTNAHEARGS